MQRLVLLLACLLAVDCALVGVNPVATGRRVFHQRNLHRGSRFGANNLHFAVKTPVKASAVQVPADQVTGVKVPSSQVPKDQVPTLQVPTTPVPAVQATVIQSPVVPTLSKKGRVPIVQRPLIVQQETQPVHVPAVEVPLPIPHLVQEPVQAPVQELGQTPVQQGSLVQEQVHAPVQQGLLIQEQVHAPVQQGLLIQEQVHAPVQGPLVQEHLQLPVEHQVVEEQLVHSTSGAFSCKGRLFGYYADVQRGCKVYHVCNPLNAVANVNDGHFTFNCPVTTRFDQRYHTCAPESVALDCNLSESLYSQTELRFANVN